VRFTAAILRRADSKGGLAFVRSIILELCTKLRYEIEKLQNTEPEDAAGIH